MCSINKIVLPSLILMLIGLISCTNSKGKTGDESMSDTTKNKFEVTKTDEEWKATLTPEQYEVLRKKSTEKPFSGKLNLNTENGIYYCAGCGSELFSSDSKYDAGCGWPSFYKSLDKGIILEKKDTSYNMVRTEIICAKCGGHLGHLFDDGPNPTGLRYCVNSLSLDFKKK